MKTVVILTEKYSMFRIEIERKATRRMKARRKITVWSSSALY